MNDPTTMHDLAVTIRTDESLLTLTPRGLLEFYLPGAKEVRPGVWQGKSSTGKDVYIQTEVLAGALMDCKEKQLNPITEIYLLPANGPDKKASYKVKYTAGLERMREMPGFLGLNSGLILVKGDEMKRSQGRMVYPGYDCYGAWAKAYFVGMPEPIEHEVDFASSVVENSPVWQERPGFMLLKVVEDELWRLKVLPRMKPTEREAIDGEAIILEGAPVREEPKPQETTAATPPPAHRADEPGSWQAGALYTGTIRTITCPANLSRAGKQTPQTVPGVITIECPSGECLRCIYIYTPDALKRAARWADLIGKQAVMSFHEKQNKQGTRYRFVDTLDVLTDDQPAAAGGEIPAVEPPAAPPAQPTDAGSTAP